MVQFCVAALPLLLLGSLAIETSHWHVTRQRLTLAIERATHDTAMDGGTDQALARHLRKHLPADLHAPVTACITDPVHALMADFMDKRLSTKLGTPVIRHDHLIAQHEDAIRRGRIEGRGPRSQRTISEANVLNIRTSIGYRALSPWLRAIVDPITIRLQHRAIMQSHRQRINRPCVTLN